MKIKSDLVGVIVVQVADRLIVLKAGDDVPEGVCLGEHVLEASEPVKAAAPRKK